MDTAQIRLCFLDILRDGRASEFNTIVNQLPSKAISRGFLAPTQGPNRAVLLHTDEETVREIFWSFILQGILIPGLNNANPNLPFFTLTEYGRGVINNDEPVPHDPDGYLAYLKQEAPHLDPIAMFYVEEGLECFQRGTYTASVVMLGVASEKITLDMAIAVQQSIGQQGGQRLLRAIERGRIGMIF